MVGRCHDHAAGFFRDRSGSFSVFALSGAMLALAGAAIAVDVGQIYAVRAELETTADAAALAAASRLPDLNQARQAALHYARKNMPVEKYGETILEDQVEFGHWDSDQRRFTVTEQRSSAVRIVASFELGDDNPLGMFFAPLFGLHVFEVSADAVAGKSAPPCILSLGRVLPKAVRLRGTTSIETIGCGIQINNSRRVALELKGQSSIESDAICVAGGAKIGGRAETHPAPEQYCPRSVDPLAHVRGPAVGACNFNDFRVDGRSATLVPGVYCGGLQISNGAHVTFLPGEYTIKDGAFSVRDDSSIRGEEVGFQLQGALARILFDDDVAIDLTAPRSGSLEGILFFQSRNHFNRHIWKSDRVSRLTGTIYLPSGTLVADSDSQITPANSCNVIIAGRMDFLNDSGISIDISNSRCKNLLPAPFRKSVALLD